MRGWVSMSDRRSSPALNAWGGSITLGGLRAAASDAVNSLGHGRSIWVGEQALIDVAARAVSAVDNRGRRYGQVRNGGKIAIGGEIDLATTKGVKWAVKLGSQSYGNPVVAGALPQCRSTTGNIDWPPLGTDPYSPPP